MSTAAERQFFNSQGAMGICSAFTRELAKDGKLHERGDPQIDTFVATVNAKLVTPSISNADLADAKSWVKSPKILGTSAEYLLAELIKHVEANR